MKLALVYDDLIQYGGGERLLMDVQRIWPDSPVFTSVASKSWKKRCSKLNIKLYTSFLDYVPFGKVINRYLSPLLFHILAFESFDFSEFDIVLSISNLSWSARGITLKRDSLTLIFSMFHPFRVEKKLNCVRSCGTLH